MRLLIVALLAACSQDPETEARYRARAVIAECHKTVADELAHRDARLLARDTCRMLEDRFREKYQTAL
jgi:hypothetical protein